MSLGPLRFSPYKLTLTASSLYAILVYDKFSQECSLYFRIVGETITVLTQIKKQAQNCQKNKIKKREVSSMGNSKKITIWNTHTVASYRQIHEWFGLGCFMGREQEVGRV